MLGFHKKLKYIIFVGLSFWIAGIIITPLLANRQEIFFQNIASFLYFLYQPVCHQMPERSILVDGFSLAVCTRCFSFYLGGFIVSGIFVFKEFTHVWRLSRYIILVSPAMLDFIFEKLNFYSNISGLRIFTGLFLGIAVFHWVFSSISEIKPGKQLADLKQVKIVE